MLALLVVGAYTQSSGGSCDAVNNKFLAWLKSVDATIVKSSPQTGSNFAICNDIWKVEGTCCDTDKLKSTFKTKMEKHKSGWGKFISGLAKVRNILPKIEKMSSNRDAVKQALEKAKNSDATQLEGLDAEKATQLIEKVKNFKDQAKEFKSLAKACYDYTMQLRGTAFCYGCSAKSSDYSFFGSSEGKLTINQASSTGLLEKCLKPWGFMHMVGGMMQMLAVLNKQRKSDAAGPKRPEGNKPAHGNIAESDVFDGFKECTSASPSGSCTQDMLNKLVSAHFNIMSPPKRASDDNMSEDSVSSADSVRLLQSSSSYSGDASVSSSGADLTRSVGAPQVDASIDTSGIQTEEPKKAAMAAVFVAFVALLFNMMI